MGINKIENGLELMIQFEKMNDLIGTVVQDNATGLVLMVGYMNKKALDKSRELGLASFFSRSRNTDWTKGETSGDYLEIVDILVDCDQDNALMKVNMMGEGTCHTKNSEGQTRMTCFYRRITNDGNLEYLEGME